MEHSILALLGITFIFTAGCSKEQPPLDSNGKTPQQALIDTYTLMIEGKYEEAEKGFEPDFIETFATKKGKTFEEYCQERVDKWPVEGLTAEINDHFRNKFNPEMWLVNIKPVITDPSVDENDPQRFARNEDLLIIDGAWKIVFGNDHPPK